MSTPNAAVPEAKDGTKVPVSIVYRIDTKRDGTAPLYQYAYGSYGISTDPSFNTVTLPAGLDKGLIVSGSGSIRGYGGVAKSDHRPHQH